MIERRRSRRLWWLTGIALAAAAVLASTIVLGADDPCGAPSAAPAAEIALMPAGLSFDRIGTVTRVRKDGDQVTVQAVTTKPLDEATVLIQDAAVAAGYRPAGMDSEGAEAEVFFTKGSYAAGQARVRPSECPGQWDIDLVLVDRDAASATVLRSAHAPGNGGGNRVPPTGIEPVHAV
jgi:hypothetical protein